MITVTVERIIEAPLAQVWAILADFGNIDWIEGPESVEVVGSGVGMIRKLKIPGIKQPIDEVLEHLDAVNASLRYSIPKHPVVPFENYNATISLSAPSEEKTAIVWEATFTSEKMSEADASSIMHGNYSRMLDNLDSKLAA